ncbi:TPA: hypothetical protein N0F65_011554 [Lagenidium giganteum]|uniref:DNA topoisomerase n=1 Tax=Lagenidium giganteum TaxID=4803 RepID=A0AAV2YN29_9STRA|nr:TPA: hypothetical protein N0F65_011554 [Lagenidium giganteum]
MVLQVLNVAEKPSVAKEISNILSSGSYQWRQGFSQYNPLYEFQYQIQNQPVRMVMTSVIGHLMEMDFPPEYRGWQTCDPAELFTAPIHKKTRSDETQKKIEKTLRAEAARAQWLVLWLDCDREGENIAFEVKAICEHARRGGLRVLRARFSALIPRDIVYAVQHLTQPDEKLSLACDARSEIDLRIGAAFTRFQTMRLQRKFPELDKGVISYGPCQFPTLGFVVERYMQIQNFEREAFYFIAVTHEAADDAQPGAPPSNQPRPSTSFTWKRARLYDRLACLCIYEELLDNPMARILSVQKKATSKRKPLPLTTVELQKCASRWLRLSSEQTMKAAESLYNKGFISYPRTETNKFKEGTDLRALIQLHENHSQWGRYVSQSLLQQQKFEHPRAGNADDQAHPPIHPTKAVDLSSITDPAEKKVYELVTLHFLACCSRDAKGHQTNVRMGIAHEEFTATGLMVTERNYLDIYRFEKWSTSTIPVYQEGATFMPTTMLMQSGETAPPPLLSESDLIAKMDAHGIGTDATIAEHIKTIQKREYAVKVNNNTQFKPTALGLALVMAYEQMGFELAKPALRAAMERDCKAISLGQKDVRAVVQSCLHQMKEIFLNVTRSAEMLDLTFAEHFNSPSDDLPTPSFSGGQAATARTSDDRRPTTTSRPPSARDNSVSGSSSSSAVPMCNGHNLPCIERTVNRDGTNKGRKFYVCSLSRDEQCDHFDWADAPAGNTQRTRSSPVPSSNSAQASPMPTPASGGGSVPSCNGHNLPCVERTVNRDGPNKGRQFYVCSLPRDDQCDHFAWADAVTVSIVCSGHNEPCAERVVRKDGPNKGREFFSCPRPQIENCGFFKWKDEVTGTDSSTPSYQTPAPTQRPTPRFDNNRNNHISGGNDTVPQCAGHRAPCALRTCKKPGDNLHRQFYACAAPPQDSCGYFLWKDERGPSQPSANNFSSNGRVTSGTNNFGNHRNGLGAQGDDSEPQCDCGTVAARYTCRNGANQGRQFFKCSNPDSNQQCKFFQWAS